MKFEEAYSSYDHKCHTIEEVSGIYQSSPALFTGHYKKSLFCPVCRKARLSYNHASTPYFQTYPKAEHDPYCELRQEELSPRASFAFSQETANLPVIHRQMESLLNNLLFTQAEQGTVDTPDPLPQTPDRTFSYCDPASRKQMPRKRIDLPMREEDYFYTKYFYGEVRLKWEKSGSGYKVLLYHKEKSYLLCRLYVSMNVYNHLPGEWKSPNAFCCGIVFLGQASPVDKNGKRLPQDQFESTKNEVGRYFLSGLLHSEHLLIRKG